MNKPKLLHFSYKRYLINFLRDRIDFEGVPLRVVARGRGERGEEEEEFEAVYQSLNAPTEFTLGEYVAQEDDEFEYYQEYDLSKE